VLTYESNTAWGSAARFERMVGQEESEEVKELTPEKTTREDKAGADAEAS